MNYPKAIAVSAIALSVVGVAAVDPLWIGAYLPAVVIMVFIIV